MKIKNEWILKNLYISQLDDLSGKFNWFPSELLECDRNSIKQDGIRLPFLVQQVDASKFVLIDGFKRLSWLKYVQEKSGEEFLQELLPCLIIPEKVSIKDVAKIKLETLSVDHNSFPGIQLCRVLNMLSNLGFSKNEITFQVFPILGLTSSMRLTSQLMDLQRKLLESKQHTESPFRGSIITSMEYEDLIPLLKFSGSDFHSVLRLAEKMEVKGKKWRNLLQVLDEVIRLQETKVSEILNSPEIQILIKESNIQGPVRYRLLKQKLHSLRYPELSKMQKRFDQGKKSLKLGDKITLESDQYFENDELALKMKFSSVDELRYYLMNVLNSVDSAKTVNVWNDLFSILREE